MPIKTIIFDFGNVVGFFNNRRTIERLAPYSSLSAEQMLKLLVSSKLEVEFEHGRLNSAEFIRQGKEIACLNCADEIVQSAWEDIFWANEAVCEVLPRLKPTYRLLLGSNTNELHANFYRKQFADSIRHFDHLVLSHEIRARKPHADFYLRCVENSGCTAAECLFIDDLPANIKGAKAVGLQGLVYHPKLDLPASLAELGIQLAPVVLNAKTAIR